MANFIKKAKGIKLLGVFLLVAVVTICGAFLLAWKFYDVGYSICTQDINNIRAEEEFKAGIPPTGTPIPTPTVSLASYKWYKAVITTQSNQSNEIDVLDTISNALNLAKVKGDLSADEAYDEGIELLRKVIPDLALKYNTSEGNVYQDRGNSVYFFPVSLDGREIAGKYDYAQSTIELSEVPSNLNKFLADNKYCQTESDCLIRNSFCIRGAFNKYERYIDAWGCGGSPQGDIGFDNVALEKLLQCRPIVQYSHVSCIENKCIAQGATMSCDKTILP